MFGFIYALPAILNSVQPILKVLGIFIVAYFLIVFVLPFFLYPVYLMVYNLNSALAIGPGSYITRETVIALTALITGDILLITGISLYKFLK